MKFICIKREANRKSLILWYGCVFMYWQHTLLKHTLHCHGSDWINIINVICHICFFRRVPTNLFCWLMSDQGSPSWRYEWVARKPLRCSETYVTMIADYFASRQTIDNIRASKNMWGHTQSRIVECSSSYLRPVCIFVFRLRRPANSFASQGHA